MYLWPKFGEIPFIGFWDMVFTSFSGHCLLTLTFDLLTPKCKQYTYEPKYICDQNWVKFSLLVFEIWCSQVIRVTACCDLDLWPYDPKIQSTHLRTEVYLWPKFGEIPFIGFWHMVLQMFSGHCLLWPWPLTFWPQNLISTSATEVYLWPKFGEIPFTGFWDMVFTRFSVHLQTKVHLWPESREIPFIGFWDMVFTRFSGRTDALKHSRTYSQTDRPENSIPPVPFFNRAGGIKNN